MINVKDILSSLGVFMTIGWYHEYHGRISWLLWGISWVPLEMFSTVGRIMIRVEAYHEYHGGVQYRESTQITNNDILQRYWTPTQYSRYPPHLLWYPLWYWTSPSILKISPTILNIPWYSRYSSTFIMIFSALLNLPHCTQDIPYGTEHTLYRVIIPVGAISQCYRPTCDILHWGFTTMLCFNFR